MSPARAPSRSTPPKASVYAFCTHDSPVAEKPRLFAGAVGPQERRDDEVTDLHGADVGADRLDNADEFVSHALAGLAGFHRPVRPEIAAADGGAGDDDESVGRLDEAGVGDGLDTNVAGAVHDSCSHVGDYPSVRRTGNSQH